MELHEIEQAVKNVVNPITVMRSEKAKIDVRFDIPKHSVADHFHALIGHRYCVMTECIHIDESELENQHNIAKYLRESDKRIPTVQVVTIHDMTEILPEYWQDADYDVPAIMIVLDDITKAHQVMSLLFKLLYTVECP